MTILKVPTGNNNRKVVRIFLRIEPKDKTMRIILGYFDRSEITKQSLVFTHHAPVHNNR